MENNNQNKQRIPRKDENKNTKLIKKDDSNNQKGSKYKSNISKNSENKIQNDNNSSQLSSKLNKINSISKKTGSSSFKIEKLVEPIEKKQKIEEISNLIQNLGNENQILSKKLNIMRNENEALVKLFHSFNIQQEKRIETKMNNKMFENKYIEKFALKYNLNGFDYFPYIHLDDFDNDFEIQTIEFYYLAISDDNKKKEYCFSKDKKIFTIQYDDDKFGNLFFIIEREKDLSNGEDIFSVLALKQDDKGSFGIPKIFEIEQEKLIVSFCEEDFSKSKLEDYYEIQDLYSKFNDYKEKKSNNNRTDSEEKEYIENLKEAIKNKNEALKKNNKTKKKDDRHEIIKEHILTISIYKVEEVLDGFFTNPLEIEIIIEKGVSKKIPSNSYIIVEAKNHNNIKEIKENLFDKKFLLESLQIPLETIFIVGILNSKPIIDEHTIDTMKNLTDNFIILYPSSLDDNEDVKYYDTKIENKKEINSLQNKIDDIKKNTDKIPTLLVDMKTMKKDIDEIKKILINIQNHFNQHNPQNQQQNQQQKTNQE